MFIIRTQTTGSNNQTEIRTFTFDSEDEMNMATKLLRQTPSKGFAATVQDEHSMRGKIFASWDKRTRSGGSLNRTVQSGAYKDSIYETFGLKDECYRAARETNEKATCWASTTANVQHVAGSLYKTIYREPFTD